MPTIELTISSELATELNTIGQLHGYANAKAWVKDYLKNEVRHYRYDNAIATIPIEEATDVSDVEIT